MSSAGAESVSSARAIRYKNIRCGQSAAPDHGRITANFTFSIEIVLNASKYIQNEIFKGTRFFCGGGVTSKRIIYFLINGEEKSELGPLKVFLEMSLHHESKNRSLRCRV
jgi:hypothetical protein